MTTLIDSGELYRRYHELEGNATRLGRHLWLDARSLAYMVENDLEAMSGTLASKAWERHSPILDQGQLGSCTGNAGTGDLGTSPLWEAAGHAFTLDEGYAVKLYEDATVADGYPGCLVADQLVLTSDFRWVPIQKLSPGDTVLGFDEHGGRAARYREATVLANDRRVKPAYSIVTDRGAVTCSDEHLFIRRNGKHDTRQWVRADALQPGDHLVHLAEPCEPDLTYEGGWVAGFFDGEGCVDGCRVSAYQVEGPILQKARAILEAHGYDVIVSGRNDGGMQLRIGGGAREQLRFLSEFWPERLVRNARRGWEGASTAMKAPGGYAVVQDVRTLGREEVWATKTSTETLIVEGLLSHNSYPPDDTGSSGLAVCRVLRARGLVTGYRWARTPHGFLRLLQAGPVMMGLPWMQSFFDPDAQGFVDTAANWGQVAGGHEIEILEVEVDSADIFSSVLTFCNSWSSSWGDAGRGRMRLRTYERLSGCDLKQPTAA